MGMVLAGMRGLGGFVDDDAFVSFFLFETD
jgi:hypothetical protein